MLRLNLELQSKIYKYENGIVTNIPLDKIEKMANLFNVSPSELTGWEDNNNKLSTPSVLVREGVNVEYLTGNDENISEEDIELQNYLEELRTRPS